MMGCRRATIAVRGTSGEANFMFRNRLAFGRRVLQNAILVGLALAALVVSAAPIAALAPSPDILFQNRLTGQLVDWRMNGTSLIDYTSLTDPGAANWKIVGSGDFNGDGKA